MSESFSSGEKWCNSLNLDYSNMAQIHWKHWLFWLLQGWKCTFNAFRYMQPSLSPQSFSFPRIPAVSRPSTLREFPWENLNNFSFYHNRLYFARHQGWKEVSKYAVKGELEEGMPEIPGSLSKGYSGFCALERPGETWRKPMETERMYTAGSVDSVAKEFGKEFWKPWWIT